jgi:hypothetical protein
MQDRYYNPEEAEQGTKKKSRGVWKKELTKKLYVDKGGVYFPVDNIRMMLIGNKFRPGAAKVLGSYIEKNKATEYLSFCKGCVWIRGIKHARKVYLEPVRKTYDDYDERSFVGATKARGLTRRPLFCTPWSLTFMIEVTSDLFDQSKIRELFDVAGLRCGLGAYGPTFGRFQVTGWELVEATAKDSRSIELKGEESHSTERK